MILLLLNFPIFLLFVSSPFCIKSGYLDTSRVSCCPSLLPLPPKFAVHGSLGATGAFALCLPNINCVLADKGQESLCNQVFPRVIDTDFCPPTLPHSFLPGSRMRFVLRAAALLGFISTQGALAISEADARNLTSVAYLWAYPIMLTYKSMYEVSVRVEHPHASFGSKDHIIL